MKYKRIFSALFVISFSMNVFSQEIINYSEGPGNNFIQLDDTACIDIQRFKDANPKKNIRSRTRVVKQLVGLGVGGALIVITGGAAGPGILLWIAGTTAFELAPTDQGRVTSALVLGYADLMMAQKAAENGIRSTQEAIDRPEIDLEENDVRVRFIKQEEDLIEESNENAEKFGLSEAFEKFSLRVNDLRREKGKDELSQNEIVNRLNAFNRVGLACKGFQGPDRWVVGLINQRKLTKKIAE